MEKKDWERLVENLKKGGILRSAKIVRAMRLVLRVNFLPENMLSYSASDTPLPIGFGQTVSAPHSFSFDAELGETWFQ